MLSVEKLPPDPPCPPPQLIKEVDLSKQTLLDENNSLPKFSIRDYVFTARSKDLKTNWPFSQKNLQSCLRHGVKEVLPPFQSLDSVRNQPLKIRCTVEDENRSNLDIAATSGHVHHDHAVLDSFHNAELKEIKLAEACTDTTTTSCRSEGENDFPSTITSISQSEIEESVPNNRPSSSPIETDTSLEAASVEVEAAGRPPIVAKKIERTTRPPSGKKSRLVVKYSSHSEKSSTEDIASNCSNISEAMTSKICPVCKTFSSSSNTTLNAHIDQCLSGESTPKWTVEESKVTTRHRIKPRKTKLMVDIYITAQHCTLEDLDRRNGSSWATTISSFPTNEDKEKSDQMPHEEKRQRVSSVYPEPDDIDVGAVYVDANGTKVRILSKFEDVPSPSVSKVVEHLRPSKPSKGGKGSKFLSAKKKKHHKYLKLAPQSKNVFSPKAHTSEFREDEESYGVKENREERHQMEKQVNPYNPLALRRWACSKRTGIGKKLNRKDDHHTVKSKWHVSRNFLVESDQTCFPVEGNCVRNFSRNPISSSERSASIENEFYDSQASDKSDCSPQRKRAGSPLSEAGMSDNVERSLKRNSRHFSKDCNFAHDGDCEPMFSNNTVGTAASPTESYGSRPYASLRPSKSHGTSRSNSMKFPSSKKITSSVGGQLSLTENDAAFVKKSQVHERSERDKEEVDWDSEDDRGYDFMYNCAGKQSRRGDNTNEASPRRSTVLEMRRNRGSISYPGRREPVASESSQLAPECSGYDRRTKMDTSVRVGDEFVDKVDCFGLAEKEDQIPADDIVTKTSSLIGVGETVTRFCNSVDHELHVLGRRSKAKSSCFQYKGSLSETEALTSPTDPRIDNEQEMLCADEVEDGTLGHNAEELDSEVGQGSYFTEVDPIPIPGPPGSFLPSPRDMGSDDFQGNSSLTTSRVQSSQDPLDFVDGDTSDSPISTTSTISNSTGTNQDRKFSEPLSSTGPQSVQEKIQSGLSSSAASDASVEINAAVLQQITGNLAESTFDRENFRVNKISLEKGPLGFKSNDDQPCCCQRKERTSQGLALNYQESPLLRRRAMASVIPATMGKQMGCSPSNRTNNAEMRSDMTDLFFLNGCANSRPEQVAIPFTKSPAGPVPLKGPPDGKGKVSGHSDCGSVSPSGSSSVLRLMGKNLMVVNRDEEASPVPPGQAQPHAQINHLTSQFPTFSSGVSPGNLPNLVYSSFHHGLAHGSVILGKVEECFDGTHSKSFRSYINPKMPPVLARGPPSLFPKQHTDGGFLVSKESHEYKGDYHFPIPLHKSASKPMGASTFHKNANSDLSGNKEIIIIDDLDCEADQLNAVNYSDWSRESQAASSGISIPAAPSYNSKRQNPPLSCYQSPEQPSLLCGSPVLYNTSFHAVPSRRANASSVRWNCTPDGSGVLQRSPFHATSTPSRGLHMRSTLYNPPSLS